MNQNNGWGLCLLFDPNSAIHAQKYAIERKGKEQHKIHDTAITPKASKTLLGGALAATAKYVPTSATLPNLNIWTKRNETNETNETKKALQGRTKYWAVRKCARVCAAAAARFFQRACTYS